MKTATPTQPAVQPTELEQLKQDALAWGVPLRDRAGNTTVFAFVNEEDHAEISRFRWSRSSKGYATRALPMVNGRGTGTILMHRQILGLQRGDGLCTDHINGHRLDNRRSNLRVVTYVGNAQNKASARGSSSRFRGVYWSVTDKRWCAHVKLNGKTHWLGSFKDEAEAGEVAAAFRIKHMPWAEEDRWAF